MIKFVVYLLVPWSVLFRFLDKKRLSFQVKYLSLFVADDREINRCIYVILEKLAIPSVLKEFNVSGKNKMKLPDVIVVTIRSESNICSKWIFQFLIMSSFRSGCDFFSILILLCNMSAKNLDRFMTENWWYFRIFN